MSAYAVISDNTGTIGKQHSTIIVSNPFSKLYSCYITENTASSAVDCRTKQITLTAYCG